MSEFKPDDTVRIISDDYRDGNTCTVLRRGNNEIYHCHDHVESEGVVLYGHEMKRVDCCPDCKDVDCVSDEWRDDSGVREIEGKECTSCGHVWDKRPT